MKYLSIIGVIAMILAAGCGKDQQVDTAAAEPAAPSKSTESQPQTAAESMTSEIQKLGNSAMQAASSLNWQNFSWDDISNVPYSDKDKLLAWAAPKIESMKEQLTKAAMTKGKMSLSNLGDTGWQGAVKSTVEALDQVRNSSPETWEMARGALISAWESLEKEVAKYTGES